MSTVKIKNAKQLAQFLRVLAEESINSASVDVEDERMHQKKVANASKRDLGRFMSEQDADPAAGGAPPPEPPPTDLATEPAPDTKTKPAPAPTPAGSPAGEQDPLEPSFDAMTRAILDLRSGKSVKDSAIETELEAYYDRLQDAERYAMIIFLRALSGIVTGKMTGAQAAEPSDEPHGITISRGGEEGTEAPAEPSPEAPPEGAAPSDVGAGEPPSEPPAPAGPIQVGSPVTEAFRERIRMLIRSNR